MRLVFARRQSPDWAALAADYRAGHAIDPRRFVPDHPIPGFPEDIAGIIAAWNASFNADFFTCRARLAALSAASIAAIPGAVCFDHDDIDGILGIAAREDFWLFFHDDDDLFAPGMAARLQAGIGNADLAVFPLYRVHNDLFTFVREGAAAEFIWGRRQSFHFRFQSNNYAISSRICSPAMLRAMKDHVEASAHADRLGLTETVLPFAVSATVKTPCAASVVGGLVADKPAFVRDMAAFAGRFAAPDLPDQMAWLRDPLAEIAAMFGQLTR
jgi:hypothetical protein